MTWTEERDSVPATLYLALQRSVEVNLDLPRPNRANRVGFIQRHGGIMMYSDADPAERLTCWRRRGAYACELVLTRTRPTTRVPLRWEFASSHTSLSERWSFPRYLYGLVGGWDGFKLKDSRTAFQCSVDWGIGFFGDDDNFDCTIVARPEGGAADWRDGLPEL